MKQPFEIILPSKELVNLRDAAGTTVRPAGPSPEQHVPDRDPMAQARVLGVNVEPPLMRAAPHSNDMCD